MLPSRISSDFRRLCGLGLPPPIMSAALAPIVRNLLGCNVASFTRVDPEGTLSSFALSDTLPPKEVLALYADTARIQEMESTVSDDLWTFLRSGQKFQNTAGFMKDLIHSPLYEQAFIPQGFHQAVRVALSNGARPVGMALVGRPPGERAFNQREVDKFVELSPWISHALSTSLERAGTADDPLAEEGTAILNRTGKAIYRCRDGQRLLGMLSTHRGVVEPAGQTWLPRLLGKLAHDCRATFSGKPAAPPSWQGATAWGWFTLRASPLEGETTEVPELIAVRIVRRVPLTLKVAAILAANGMLSPRQKDVCLGLAEGLSRTEIAARLGIRASTVISHTQEIYARLGVDSREEMLRIVLGGFTSE